VQSDGLALSSFNFDNVGVAGRVQAKLCGVLGTKASVKGVVCYGVPWNGQPTAIGELESVAVATEDAYVAFTLTRTGAPESNEGAAAKSADAGVGWSGGRRRTCS